MGGGSPRRAGFSLIEAMVSAAVLGIGLLGLVHIHKSSIRGTVRSTRLRHASEIARQAAEQIAAIPYQRLAAAPTAPENCGPGLGAPLPVGPNGCRGADGVSTVPAPVKPLGCTYNTDSGAVLQATDPNGNALRDGLPTDPFRVDVAISQHPNPALYPSSGLVTVWVCFTDEAGYIHEITTSRVVTQFL